MNRNREERFWHIVPIFISILALVVSSTIAIGANRRAAEAVQAAQEANQKAETANQIALGSDRLYPKLRIAAGSSDSNIELTSINDLDGTQIKLSAFNEGETFLDAANVELISLPMFSYGLESNEERFDFGSVTELVEFDQLLNPDGVVIMDITDLVIKQLNNSTYSFQEPEAVYRATFNLVLVGRQVGDSIPSQPDEDLAANRTMITVDFVPSVIESDATLSTESVLIRAQIVP